MQETVKQMGSFKLENVAERGPSMGLYSLYAICNF